jgi:hypothetical protein
MRFFLFEAVATVDNRKQILDVQTLKYCFGGPKRLICQNRQLQRPERIEGLGNAWVQGRMVEEMLPIMR